MKVKGFTHTLVRSRAGPTGEAKLASGEAAHNTSRVAGAICHAMSRSDRGLEMCLEEVAGPAATTGVRKPPGKDGP